MALKCGGCFKVPQGREYLTCMICKAIYDLDCANVASKRFYNTMTAQHKKEWKCQLCKCKQPKTCNVNTPVRNPEPNDRQDEEQNVTLRTKNNKSSSLSIDQDSELSIILGDTITEHKNMETKIQPEFTLQNLSYLISEQLHENNKTIISQLKDTIQSEISKAILQIKQDLKSETDGLHKQNSQRKSEIEKLTREITILKNENEQIQKEITKLRNNTGETPKIYNTRNGENEKKIVLYGIEEMSNESEPELHIRIIEMFRECLQIDLLGYIEDTHRIGKYNERKNRPLVIELLSKRMTKYLLGRKNHLYGTGISLSPLLDDKSRKERNMMRDEMISARKKGLHAVIRDNQLYIQGKKIKIGDAQNNIISNSPKETETKYSRRDKSYLPQEQTQDGHRHSFRN